MTSITSVSLTELKNRRQELQNQRRIKFCQAMWRSLLISSMAGGLFWLITLPNWVIRQGSQINIEGNQFLSKEAIRALIPLSYPQSLLHIQPQRLGQNIELTAPIAQVTVTRQILPPSLAIKVKERKPVAIAKSPLISTNQTNAQALEEGFLDEQGIWMPKSSYSQVEKNFQFPTLKVTGVEAQHLPYWSELYRVISRSTVKIFEINWQDSTNLILKTELGNVHCGPYTDQLPQQLVALAQMRELPEHVNAGKIAYIDLTNIESPSVQMFQEKSVNPDE